MSYFIKHRPLIFEGWVLSACFRGCQKMLPFAASLSKCGAKLSNKVDGTTWFQYIETYSNLWDNEIFWKIWLHDLGMQRSIRNCFMLRTNNYSILPSQLLKIRFRVQKHSFKLKLFIGLSSSEKFSDQVSLSIFHLLTQTTMKNKNIQNGINF